MKEAVPADPPGVGFFRLVAKVEQTTRRSDPVE